MPYISQTGHFVRIDMRINPYTTHINELDHEPAICHFLLPDNGPKRYTLTLQWLRDYAADLIFQFMQYKKKAVCNAISVHVNKQLSVTYVFQSYFFK